MKEVIGTCKFCGQTRMVRVNEDLTPEEERQQADYDAAMQCRCDNSKQWAEMESNITYAQSYVRNRLVADSRVKELLVEAVEVTGRMYADKVVIQSGEVEFKVYEKKNKVIVRKKRVIEEGMDD